MLKPVHEQLLELVKAGLWNIPVNNRLFDGVVDWNELLALSDQQTVTGIITDAIATLPEDKRPPKSIYFLFLKRTEGIEKENKEMYQTIPSMVNYFSDKDIRVLLLKGQGVGLCYRNPYRRTTGDVDFYAGLKEGDYGQAKGAFEELGIRLIEEVPQKKHAEYSVDGIKVELHGNIRFTISKQFDGRFEDWMDECLKQESFVVKKAGEDNKIFLPPYRFDAVFIFAHALNHYMTSGLGLRQLCDWMCYLKKNHDKINKEELVKDLEYLGLTKFWKHFAAIAVEKLGMEKGMMPLYEEKYNVYQDKILSHIFSTGNFGYLQRKKQNNNDFKLWKKLKTFYGQLFLYWDNFWMFPKETWYCFKYFVAKNIANY